MAIRKFKIGGKIVTFISGGKANRRLSRLGMVTPNNQKVFKKMSDRSVSADGKNRLSVGFLKGKHLEALGYRNAFNEILGVQAGGGLKKKAFINSNRYIRSQGSLRRTVNHELFHTTPIIGGSEIGAHFAGGLFSKKGKLSFKEGAKQVRMFKKTRNAEFKREIRKAKRIAVGAALGAGASVGAVIGFRRVRGRIVPIRKKRSK